MSKTIVFDNYEVNDLERTLEYAIECKKNETIKGQEKWDSRAYDIMKINILLKRVRGENFKPNYQRVRSEYDYGFKESLRVLEDEERAKNIEMRKKHCDNKESNKKNLVQDFIENIK